MKQLLIVFVGGGTGSICRFLLGKLLNNNDLSIPYGTFAANIIGSLLIGLILGYVAKYGHISQHITLLLATGFCGGFTTFSTFAYENHAMIKSGDFLTFAIYLILSIILGFLAVFAGVFIAERF